MILDADGKPVMQGRKLEDFSANELRAKLFMAGIDYPANASKSDLINLIKANKI